MAVRAEQARWRAARVRFVVLLAVLAVVWGALPLVPESTGLRFGWVYQVFFTVMALLAQLFFWFLGLERIRMPERPAAVVGSVAGVFLVTVVLLVGAGVIYPQFPVPQPKRASAGEGQQAAERGRELFTSPSVGCFRCHRIAGKGGVRGPDLTQVATTAGGRVEGLTAKEYLLAKVRAGSTYDFRVPRYAPMMPAFKALVAPQQIDDLVAYLLTLGAGAPEEEVEDSESAD